MGKEMQRPDLLPTGTRDETFAGFIDHGSHGFSRMKLLRKGAEDE
jgi:hypothetical protein